MRPAGAQSRKQNRQQQRDDGDHHQQLNEGKTLAIDDAWHGSQSKVTTSTMDDS
jgi:hypothetical protein